MTKPRSSAPEGEAEKNSGDRGRTEQHRVAKSFDALASEIVELPKQRYKGLPVTATLRVALEQARNTVSKPARRRHVRHIAGRLRNSELEVRAIRAYLAGRPYVQVEGDEVYRDLAAIRESLCDPATYLDTLERVRHDLPYLDVALVERLALEFHATQDDKSYRALYKELNRAVEEAERAEIPTTR